MKKVCCVLIVCVSTVTKGDWRRQKKLSGKVSSEEYREVKGLYLEPQNTLQ